MIDLNLQRKIRNIAKKHGLKLLVLFGSQATGRVHAKSDVDAGYLSDREIGYREVYDITLKLSRVFKNPDVELVNINAVSPEFKKQIADQGIVLYERDAALFDFFTVRAERAYRETKPLRSYRDAYVEKFLHTHAE